MNPLLHHPPDFSDIYYNQTVEPEGERLRRELTDWLEKNRIVSVRLDTPGHCVDIQAAPRLPPAIKPVLTLWGSIYVRDTE